MCFLVDQLYLTDKKRKFFLGTDPGYTNFGLDFRDLLSKEHHAMNVDMRVVTSNGKRVAPSTEQYGERVLQLLRILDLYMQETVYVGIERPPPFNNKDISLFIAYFEQSIRILYPHIQIFYVDGKNVRNYTGTCANTYLERKKASWFTPYLSDKDRDIVRDVFCKEDANGHLREHVDSIEAFNIAMYGGDNVKQLALLRSRLRMNIGPVPTFQMESKSHMAQVNGFDNTLHYVLENEPVTQPIENKYPTQAVTKKKKKEPAKKRLKRS